ncbi:MAG TPA: hypothetical protein VEH80_11930 [Candidatus Bathyarchaeia archaeon]|nr:hypothetical protein [Candidatus Bathyarchaeia archaeon]
MDTARVGYATLLRITWLLAWRGALINVVLAGAAGALVGVVFLLLGGSGSRWLQPVSWVAGVAVGLFASGPILVRMLLRKRFRGFRLVFTQEP